jgi:hypothetical protein
MSIDDLAKAEKTEETNKTNKKNEICYLHCGEHGNLCGRKCDGHKTECDNYIKFNPEKYKTKARREDGKG